jgi:hypothetical protein
MKKIVCLTITLIFITACTPKVGSKEWCKNMKEKDKGDWTMTETKDYAKHCIF